MSARRVAAAVLAVVVLVGCGPEPAGVVVDRTTELFCSNTGCAHYRYLIVDSGEGTTRTRVNIWAWRSCQVGDRYPECRS